MTEELDEDPLVVLTMDNVAQVIFKQDQMLHVVMGHLVELQDRVTMLKARVAEAHQENDTVTAMDTTTRLLVSDGEKIAWAEMYRVLTGEEYSPESE